MFILEVFVSNRDDDRHEVDDTLDTCLVGLKHTIAAFLGEVSDADFELEDSEFELLNLLLNVLRVEIADVRLFPSLL